MGETAVTALLVLGGLLLFLGFAVYELYKSRKYLQEKIRRTYGCWPEREYDYEEFDAITHYYQLRKKENLIIDDITWNDLDMDRIFMLLNHTWSCIGESYLYSMLRMPVLDEEVLKERRRLSDYFVQHPKERELLEYSFAKIGKTGRHSVFDYIYNLAELPVKHIWPHLGWCVAIVAAFGSIFWNPAYGMLIFLAVLSGSWITYSREKKKILPYLLSVNCLVQILKAADSMEKINIPELKAYQKEMKNVKEQFKKLKHNTFFVLSGGEFSLGGLEKILIDYLNCTFHLDLMQFQRIVRELAAHRMDLEKLIDAIGSLECATAIASFQTMMQEKGICTPKLQHADQVFLKGENLYHPLIQEPVKNSIEAAKGVLLTGSNASGKSTFLKTVAINAILAQTIYVCTADAYESSVFQIFTSMALKDDLMEKESYFIVEIKSLKRILEQRDEEIPVLCFIDEVLRGTNTVERIAASSEILKSMAKKTILCFAATHDIELTHILEEDYENYHFQEEVREQDILFNYQLLKGRAVSRNAIRLLEVMGYDEKIIEHAQARAERFLETGEWK